MAWYDLFAASYDRALENLYREQRVLAAQALDLRAGSVVLDLPCGTGQSLDVLAPAVPDGLVVGADRSAGMLAKARARAARHGWTNTRFVEADVHRFDAAAFAAAAGRDVRPDRLLVFLGLSTFPAHEEAFRRLWDLLAPGGRAVVVDVHADPLTLQGRLVNLVARADIRRRTWTPLEAVADSFERRPLPSVKQHGGQMFLATGVKKG